MNQSLLCAPLFPIPTNDCYNDNMYVCTARHVWSLYSRPGINRYGRQSFLWSVEQGNERSLSGMGLTRERWCCAGRWLSGLDMNTYQTSIKTGILLYSVAGQRLFITWKTLTFSRAHATRDSCGHLGSGPHCTADC